MWGLVAKIKCILSSIFSGTFTTVETDWSATSSSHGRKQDLSLHFIRGVPGAENTDEGGSRLLEEITDDC